MFSPMPQREIGCCFNFFSDQAIASCRREYDTILTFVMIWTIVAQLKVGAARHVGALSMASLCPQLIARMWF
jgi:hypothetical protein